MRDELVRERRGKKRPDDGPREPVARIQRRNRPQEQEPVDRVIRREYGPGRTSGENTNRLAALRGIPRPLRPGAKTAAQAGRFLETAAAARPCFSRNSTRCPRAASVDIISLVARQMKSEVDRRNAQDVGRARRLRAPRASERRRVCRRIMRLSRSRAVRVHPLRRDAVGAEIGDDRAGGRAAPRDRGSVRNRAAIGPIASANPSTSPGAAAGPSVRGR